MDIVTIGQRMRLRRKELKLTQAELAKLVGVGQNTVSNWEQGQWPPWRSINKLVIHLKCSVAWLAGEGGESDQPESSDSKATAANG